MPIDELHDPVNYSWWWAVVGLVLLVAVAAVVFWIWRRTRPQAAPVAATPAPVPVNAADALRAEFARRLDELEGEYRSGGIDERSLHLALSAQMREFASKRIGRDASTLTLTEIRQIAYVNQLGPLIERFYFPSFADYETSDAAHDEGLESIERARMVVRTW